jgi:hypothetical protein
MHSNTTLDTAARGNTSPADAARPARRAAFGTGWFRTFLARFEARKTALPAQHPGKQAAAGWRDDVGNWVSVPWQ